MSRPKYYVTKAEEEVTKVYPNAYAHRSVGQRVVNIYLGNGSAPTILGKGFTVHNAWESAAKKVKLAEVTR